MPLTDVKIRQAKPGAAALKLTDSGGLYLEVRPNGSKLWRYRYRIAGKENVFALGAYPQVTLADARAERDVAREHVKAGRHPSHVRQTEKAQQLAENRNTFKAVAEEWIDERLSARTDTYRRQVRRVFEAEVYPRIGRLPMREITAAHVLDILTRMSKRGATAYALHVRQWISAVFRFGVATLRADADPASALKGAIQRRPINHSKPMMEGDLAKFYRALAGYKGHRVTVIALQLLPMLFIRTIELRCARWSEFDLDAALWEIPAERMKMRRKHLVPLPRQALELLQELRRITAGELLFPGLRHPDKPISVTTLNRALEYLGMEGWHCHDFRATASTHLYESGRWRGEVIELQLAHVERSSTRAAYNHAQYLAERRELMQSWANFLDTAGRHDVVLEG
ncbi:tyrosine-type recombinase/integrase [Stutzerimonas nitrititolerans]|uniref:tyrosine-type recombinase/integrase n=1 Tax=Stutzerimonas nitrititolerans TaxID=2482751 RepID=UPI0028AA3A9D|nr:integrase arm-type DNA-binding domain-containing protein [Stutzerimonas nitrititolerans]